MSLGMIGSGTGMSTVVARWQTIGNTMYGYNSSGQLVKTKPATVTALPRVPAATTPTTLGGGSTYTPPRIPPTTLGGGSTYTAPTRTNIAKPATTKPSSTSTKVGAPMGNPTIPQGSIGTGVPYDVGLSGPGGSAGVGSPATTGGAQTPMRNPGGFLGQLPNFEAMMHTYEREPSTWLNELMRMQGLDPAGRNYGMSQAGLPYFQGLSILAPYMNQDFSRTNTLDPNDSLAAMLNWTAQQGGVTGPAGGIPDAGALMRNIASGLGTPNSPIYNQMISDMGPAEQQELILGLISGMHGSGAISGWLGKAMENQLNAMGTNYLGAMARSDNVGPLAEYWMRSMGFPNLNVASSQGAVPGAATGAPAAPPVPISTFQYQ
jgi:hypothetical protein